MSESFEIMRLREIENASWIGIRIAPVSGDIMALMRLIARERYQFVGQVGEFRYSGAIDVIALVRPSPLEDDEFELAVEALIKALTPYVPEGATCYPITDMALSSMTTSSMEECQIGLPPDGEDSIGMEDKGLWI